MIILKIKKNRLGPIMGRHPWVFSGGIEQIPDGLKPGEPVKLIDPDGNFLAQGYFNSYSQIAVRIWSYDETEKVDRFFFERRIRKALLSRKRWINEARTNAYRLVNAENDFLPGLIVDKYNDYLCLQIHTAGMERYREEIVSALASVVSPKGIYERSDVFARRKDYLDPVKGPVWGDVPDIVEIKENELRFLVDIKEGQKTGFFLDQRDKREALMKYCRDKKVLNTFCYSGGFTVYALAAGAKEVVSVDVSESALALAKENVKLNGFSVPEENFVLMDAKQYLREAQKNRFEVIILDPPAFIKDRRKKDEGIIGYKKINTSGAYLLTPGGILVSCSCSAHLNLSEFRYAVSEAAGRAKKSARILETYLHGPDHPELVAFTEGEYLKSLFLEIA